MVASYPIFSFIILRGQCYYCKQKLVYILPVIEFLSGIAFTTFLIYEPIHDLIILLFLTKLNLFNFY